RRLRRTKPANRQRSSRCGPPGARETAICRFAGICTGRGKVNTDEAQERHMAGNLPDGHSQRVTDFLAKVQATHRGRLLFIVDATGSRERAWDMASKLQADMFSAAARIRTPHIQLVYFPRTSEFHRQCKP